MEKCLDKTKNLPTAFFCMNDIIAYGCIRALRNRGIRIPDDVSIIGFDDLPSSSLSEPPLTTIRVSTQRIGLRALEKLSERIIGYPEEISEISADVADQDAASSIRGSPPENILIPGRLVVRESVRKL